MKLRPNCKENEINEEEELCPSCKQAEIVRKNRERAAALAEETRRIRRVRNLMAGNNQRRN